jgi:hypothetical protein
MSENLVEVKDEEPLFGVLRVSLSKRRLHKTDARAYATTECFSAISKKQVIRASLRNNIKIKGIAVLAEGRALVIASFMF